MTKTIEQINEFANFLPLGTIFEVPEGFTRSGFLTLDGQKVLKTDYPRLASRMEKTVFDNGDYLVLVSIDENLKATKGNKLVIKAI